jgi:hypothetical protein
MMRRSLYLSGAVGAALLSLVAFNAVPAHAAALLITETANSEDDLLFAGPEENTAEPEYRFSGSLHRGPCHPADGSGFGVSSRPESSRSERRIRQRHWRCE